MIGLFFLVHGFVHARWQMWWPGGGPSTSWLWPRAAGSLGGLAATLFILAAAGFFGASLGVFIQQGWWRPLVITSSTVSLLVLGPFWYRGLIVGAALDVAILIALLWAQWPSASQVGS